MPVPGEMLGDRYRLDDRIAAGGMGEVWQATDTVLGRDVAVKTLHAGRATDPGFQTRFRHEARAMAVLHHPGVADVYDYGQTGDGADAYIVMARVDGQPLNERIAERGRLTATETMSVVAQAGRALEAAHQAGIVHRDVKPGNLIIKPDGTVVLVDFGVARSAESAALTGAKEVVGTALYIAPEQVSKDVTGPLADVYALGVVAYHCLAGQPPFVADSPIAVAMQHLQADPPPLPPDVPEPVRALVIRAMAKDPAARFASAAAMAQAAEQVPGSSTGPATAVLAAPAMGTARAMGTAPIGAPTVAVAPVTAPRSGHTEVLPGLPPDPPEPRRHRAALVGAAAALLVFAVAGAVLAFVSPGWLLDDDAPPAVPVTGTTGRPSGPASAPATKDRDTEPTRRARTTEAPAPAGVATGTPEPAATPSRSPAPRPEPTRAETTEPAGTEQTTGAPASTAADDEGGDDNSGPGSGGGGDAEAGADNSGSGSSD